MSTKPYSPVKKDETEAVVDDEKKAEEEEEQEEEKVEDLIPQQQLYYFCKRGDIQGIRDVSSKGIDINARNNQGTKLDPYISDNTALHYAVLSGSIETVKVVYDLEANLETKNKLGSTPLHLAASLGYTEIVKFLIDKKAEIEAKNKIQNTPLHCAVYAGHVDTVKAILENCDDKRQSLMLPVNGVNFGAVKYTAHDDMKAYLKQFFPKKNKPQSDNDRTNINGNDVEEEPEELPNYDNDNINKAGNDVQEEEEEENEATETTGLTTGTATATEQ